MSNARRILIPGALIAIPVIFAVGGIALAQMPSSPQIPAKPLIVQLAPTEEPAPVPAPAPAPVPAPAPAPAPQPDGDDDDDDDGGDDD